MLGAAVAGTKRDETRVLGVGQRTCFDDPLKPGQRRAPVEHGGHVDNNGEVGASPRQRCFRNQPQHQRRGQQIGKFRQGHRSERTGLAHSVRVQGPGGSAPSEAAGSASLRMTAADN